MRPIPILMYHQIDAPPPRGTPLRGLVVKPQAFARQMRLLRLLGWRGLSMCDLEPYLDGRKNGKVVGITFDDGYRNNLEYALPVLQANDFTATCYGVSARPGGRNDWDAAIGVPQKTLMDHADWRQWLAGGMEIGSHTRHHVDLTTLDANKALSEIRGSKSEFEDILGSEIRHFCYPYGRFMPEHADMARAAGYHSATTTRRGRVQPGADAFTLSRIMVPQATDPLRFWIKVATAYEDGKA